MLLLASVVGISLIGMNGPAKAYYDKLDYAEYVFVQPNWTVFYIPDVGANLSGQVKFGSIDYLETARIAQKRVEIKHVKLAGTGTFTDFFVPAGRLNVVDRTPVSRVWNGATNTGTSPKDESFHFETSDSISIASAITVGATIKEEDAAKFLYWFGVISPPYDANNTANQFQSVLFSVSLATVMDTYVRGLVQAQLAEEFGKQPLLVAIGLKSQIIRAVRDTVTAECLGRGITINYLGFAQDLSFEPAIQEAIDRNFIATMDATAAITSSPALPILQAKTNMEVQRTLAAKWNGQIPSFNGVWFLPANIIETITGWFRPTSTAAK